MISQSKDGTLYEVDRLNLTKDDGLKSFEPFFDNLPMDTYADDRLRSRRYSCLKYTDSHGLAYAEHKDFVQSSMINNYNGDVERHYEDLEPELLKTPLFVQMVDSFREKTGLSEDSIIEVHQIRWHCRSNVKLPAPEGTHQDGFDFIGMFMIDTDNVDGGEIMVYEKPNSPPIFKRILKNGEYVIMNDRLLYHNAAPLVPTANDNDGHWDLIVLTAHQAHN